MPVLSRPSPCHSLMSLGLVSLGLVSLGLVSLGQAVSAGRPADVQ